MPPNLAPPTRGHVWMDDSLGSPYAPRHMSEHTPATFLGALLGNVRQWPSALWKLEASFKGVEFKGRARFIGRPIISKARDATIILGDGARIYSAIRANPLGCFQPCVLRALAPKAQLVIGADTGLSGTVLCAGASIEVGQGTIFGSGALVMDTDFNVPAGEWSWRDDPVVL